MNSRFLIPVLCIGAVVYACGPRSVSDAKSTAVKGATTLAQSTTKPAPAHASSRKNDAAANAFVARLLVTTDTDHVKLVMHVVNTSSRRVEVNFPTGQTYDFVILDSIGREMWHWGEGRMFTQALRNRLLDGGEAMDLVETWRVAALPPGRYVARGVLKSDNYPMTQTTEFVIEGATTVASREDK